MYFTNLSNERNEPSNNGLSGGIVVNFNQQSKLIKTISASEDANIIEQQNKKKN